MQFIIQPSNFAIGPRMAPLYAVNNISDTENKIAFSHYTDDLDGDWILDDYGIRSWVESLPTKSISMATLANSYRIIGL